MSVSKRKLKVDLLIVINAVVWVYVVNCFVGAHDELMHFVCHELTHLVLCCMPTLVDKLFDLFSFEVCCTNQTGHISW